jgi:hypothetical protein
VERDKPKQSESVGQTLPQLPWKQKMGDLKNVWIPFIKLDVDVTGNITAKMSEVWSEFIFFCTLVLMATVAILNFVNLPQAATHYGG